MALFGGEKREAKNEALQAELARIDSLSLDALAAETLTKGFGPDGPGASGAIRATELGGAFVPGDSTSGLTKATWFKSTTSLPRASRDSSTRVSSG
jgi:hypothetical protein